MVAKSFGSVCSAASHLHLGLIGPETAIVILADCQTVDSLPYAGRRSPLTNGNPQIDRGRAGASDHSRSGWEASMPVGTV